MLYHLWLKKPSNFNFNVGEYIDIYLPNIAEQESYLTVTTPSTTNSQSRYLDIHLYYTSIRNNEQTMLENLSYHLVVNMYEDMYTQLRTPTHVRRPPWKLLSAKFKVKYRSTNVFFFGNRLMTDEIKKHCNKHTFRF
ncbi:unnamed protein product [Adineta steineri]|nr:unnamed protein product [Adineta steineri]